MARDFVYFCKKEKDLGKTTGVTGASFKCSLCGKRLVYLPEKKCLGEHGKTEKTIEHELRQVSEPL